MKVELAEYRRAVEGHGFRWDRPTADLADRYRSRGVDPERFVERVLEFTSAQQQSRRGDLAEHGDTAIADFRLAHGPALIDESHPEHACRVAEFNNLLESVVEAQAELDDAPEHEPGPAQQALEAFQAKHAERIASGDPLPEEARQELSRLTAACSSEFDDGPGREGSE